jgi:hypothetical protein
MFKSRIKLVAALATLALASTPVTQASAQLAGNTNRACSLSSFVGFSATNCIGFYSGNLLGGSGDKVSAQNTALNTLLGTSGLNYYESLVEKIDVENDTPVDFDAQLFGTTVIGLHFGNGADVFKNGIPAYDGKGGTAFYVFEAGNGLGLDEFELIAGLSKASSGAILYRTGQQEPPCTIEQCPEPVIVPEPASFALMFGGLFGLGVVARRRRNS